MSANLVNTTSGLEKPNHRNYKIWRTCIKSYLEAEKTEKLEKWPISAGKVEDAETPKAAWEAFKALFSKKNDGRLQFLENELISTTYSLRQYFIKIKNLCHEISDLDQNSNIYEDQMRRLSNHGSS
ncbi:hypothetical protein Ddye_003247 [Dipteronia dyeriana]|uniref:Uncharacterized protein n=1 Tax=Dipteronia dyeriana TaxID=168575 RepID=A0AAD9XT86_9ROSI|nr:hypothetical protein Ddye_003247 [Dipteronia dyeriana]